MQRKKTKTTGLKPITEAEANRLARKYGLNLSKLAADDRAFMSRGPWLFEMCAIAMRLSPAGRRRFVTGMAAEIPHTKRFAGARDATSGLRFWSRSTATHRAPRVVRTSAAPPPRRCGPTP
jgi:hypothetical protein